LHLGDDNTLSEFDQPALDLLEYASNNQNHIWMKRTSGIYACGPTDLITAPNPWPTAKTFVMTISGW
jgi:hypothetical protein